MKIPNKPKVKPSMLLSAKELEAEVEIALDKGLKKCGRNDYITSPAVYIAMELVMYEGKLMGRLPITIMEYVEAWQKRQ